MQKLHKNDNVRSDDSDDGDKDAGKQFIYYFACIIILFSVEDIGSISFVDSNDTNSNDILTAQLKSVSDGRCDRLVWRAGEVREHFRLLWQTDGDLLARLFPMFQTTDSVISLDG
jgi:hypothetical protein